MTESLDAALPEILARLSEIKNADPTANVLSLVAAADRRQDDLRRMEGKWRDKSSRQERGHRRELRDMETKARDAQLLAEKARIDAVIADVKATATLTAARAEFTALGLAERVDTTAKALATTLEATAKALAGTVEATATRLAERIEPLERARYEQAGSKEQRTEGRERSQWTFERALTLVGLAAGALYFILNFKP